MKVECDCRELKNNYLGKSSIEPLHKKIKREALEKKKQIKQYQQKNKEKII